MCGWLDRVLVPFLGFQYGQSGGVIMVLAGLKLGLLEILERGKLPVIACQP